MIPKLNLLVEDGIAFVKNAPSEHYDLVIVDGSDPVGPAEGLFSVDFFKHCARILKSKGIMVTQGESPKFNDKAFKELHHTIADIFGEENTHTSLFFVPTYPTGMWSFQWGMKPGNTHPAKIEKDLEISNFVDAQGLRYYNADLHRGSFALPNFVKNMFKRELA